MKLFLQKMQNFQALGAQPPNPQKSPHCEFLATRLISSHIRQSFIYILHSVPELSGTLNLCSYSIPFLMAFVPIPNVS